MQIPLAGVPTRKVDTLDFVVVGGGIAGLASAWSLRLAGHRVTVLEQHHPDVLSKCRVGAFSPPNMTQILNDWGIGDKLAEIATPINQITCLDGRSGEELGLVDIHSAKVMEAVPADFSCVQYGALFRIFYDLANDSGVRLHFNSTVVDVDPWQGMVTCQDGRQFTADVIIAADGTDSIVRPLVIGPSAPPPESDNMFTVLFVAPADVARQDDDLAALLDAKSWTGWFGDNCSMHGVLTGPGPDRDYALTMNFTIHSDDVLEEFPMSLDSLRLNLFEPRVRKLVKFADQVCKVVFPHYQPFDNWVHESGKVVLVGQAAHPIIPAASQNTATCIEDAMTLSALFSLPATKSQTPMLLNIYEELRQPRCATVQRYIRRKREVITIPHGPGQRRRDALLREQRASFHLGDEMDDDFLCSAYTAFIHVYGFDAREVVEDWWVKWGRSIFHGTEGEGEHVDIPTSVPVVVDAEVERDGPTVYPNVSDHLIGEDDDVMRAVEARQRGQR